MQVEFHRSGIFLPEIELWLDSTEDCENNWISHAHSDHASGHHASVFGSPETLDLYRARPEEQLPAPAVYNPVDYEEPWDFRGARLIAYPASHIVGAAQLLIEWRSERLLYTGDIKHRPPICGRETKTVPCDRLIIESTFGLPIFHFLSREEARDRIVAFARGCLAGGLTPVFPAYPLGRGQELTHVLCQAGIPTAVHGAIARYLPIYESAGYACPGWEPYESRDTAGKALVMLPGFRGKDARVAYVSGWAALDNARARAGAEELIPYSDHADFEELLLLVEHSGAREVDVVHGYREWFARILKGRGITARAGADG